MGDKPPIRIFSQVGPKLSTLIASLVPEAEVIPLEVHGPIEPEASAEILLTQTWGSENIGEVVEHGVRWIHTLGTGVDRFPFDAVGERLVTCSRGASSIPIAEYVLASMLAFEKRLPDVWMRSEPERWYGERLGGLYQKTVGLVGLGGIGLAVAERALAFQMKVLASRRSDRPSPLSGVEVVGVDTMIAAADHLVLAASATRETEHLVDSELLAKAKPGLHLINVARGSLVDQEALRRALDDGTVARATLDTMTPEPLPQGHWMYEHPRVCLTPHVSWSMPGSVDLLLEKFLANFQRYKADQPLENVVDRTRGY